MPKNGRKQREKATRAVCWGGIFISIALAFGLFIMAEFAAGVSGICVVCAWYVIILGPIVSMLASLLPYKLKKKGMKKDGKEEKTKTGTS